MRLVSCISLLTLASIVAWTQTPTASTSAQRNGANRVSIHLTVMDVTTAVIPNAKVTVFGEGQKQVREGVTNDDGIFEIDDLAPAKYDIRVTSFGFKTRIVSDVSPPYAGKVRLDVASSWPGPVIDYNVSLLPPTIAPDSFELKPLPVAVPAHTRPKSKSKN